jgi:hypothetical protein
MDYLTVSLVTKDRDGKPRWTKVGAAFPNKLGGFNLRLDHDVIISDRTELVLAKPKEREESGGI